MGDLIYPGIVIARAEERLSSNDVFNYVVERIGAGQENYRGGIPVIQQFLGVKQKRIFVVSGILHNYNHIRKCFGSHQMKGVTVIVQSMDFGIQRSEDGNFPHRLLQLHNHLSEGHGNLETLNIFHDEIQSNIPQLHKLTTTIYFNDKRQNVTRQELGSAGALIMFGNTTSTEFSSQREDESIPRYNLMEISYETRADALQTILWLNGRESFASQGKGFRTSPLGGSCTISNNFGLGVNGTLMTVADTLHNGYLPFEAFNEPIIDPVCLATLRSVCFFCDQEFVLFGIGPDLNWLAGKCGCLQKNSLYTWPEENHFRLFLPLKQRETFRKLQKVDSRQTEVRRIPFAALCAEARENKKQLHLQQTIGTVVSSEVIEKVTVKVKIKKRVHIQFRVRKTKLWCEEGLMKMSKATLVPLEKICTKENSDTMVIYVEAKSHKWIKSTVCKIVSESPTDEWGTCVVAVVATVAKNVKIFKNGRYKIIPKPPTLEKDTVRRCLVLLDTFLKESDWNIGVWLSSHLSFQFVSTTLWDDSLVQFNVWLVSITIEKDITWQVLSDRLEDSYIGLEMICS